MTGFSENSSPDVIPVSGLEPCPWCGFDGEDWPANNVFDGPTTCPNRAHHWRAVIDNPLPERRPVKDTRPL